MERIGIEAAAEMSLIQEPIFGTLDNLEAFICEEIVHLDRRRRLKKCDFLEDIITTECRRFLEDTRHIKIEPLDDYPVVPSVMKQEF